MDDDVQMFANNYLETIGKANADNLFKFLLVFSRFECALKATLVFAKTNRISIEPNWVSFIEKNEKFYQETNKDNIKSSINYILTHPPKIQVFNSMENKIFWVDNNNIKEEHSELCKIVNHIKTVRNNLFHGGKFEFIGYDSVGVEEISRNHELIEHSIKILEMLIGFNSDVRKAYTESV